MAEVGGRSGSGQRNLQPMVSMSGQKELRLQRGRWPLSITQLVEVSLSSWPRHSDSKSLPQALPQSHRGTTASKALLREKIDN